MGYWRLFLKAGYKASFNRIDADVFPACISEKFKWKKLCKSL
jgi:hypothetical protein